MPLVTIDYQPNLDIGKSVRAFSAYFAGKHRAYKIRRWLLHFVVRQDAWTEVGVRLHQGSDNKHFALGPFLPSIFLTFVLGAIVTYYILYFGSWRNMEKEM